jgi:hypothetical protein
VEPGPADHRCPFFAAFFAAFFTAFSRPLSSPARDDRLPAPTAGLLARMRSYLDGILPR